MFIQTVTFEHLCRYAGCLPKSSSDAKPDSNMHQQLEKCSGYIYLCFPIMVQLCEVSINPSHPYFLQALTDIDTSKLHLTFLIGSRKKEAQKLNTDKLTHSCDSI